MKLTKEQIEIIERYILDEGVRSKYFFEEILDHYCSLVENKMTGGLDFNEAHVEVSEVFVSYQEPYGLFGQFPKYGLEALELRFRKLERTAVLNELKSFLYSSKVLVWFLLAFIFYRFYNIETSKWLLLGLYFVNLIIVFYEPMKTWTWQGTILRFKAVMGLKQLRYRKANLKLNLEIWSIFYAYIPFQLPNLARSFFDVSKENTLLISGLACILVVPISWAIASREKKLLKTYLAL